jgi:hypothetical protein
MEHYTLTFTLPFLPYLALDTVIDTRNFLLLCLRETICNYYLRHGWLHLLLQTTATPSAPFLSPRLLAPPR